MIEFEVMQPKHYKDFEYDGIEAETLQSVNIPELLAYYQTQGECYAGIVDGKVVGFAGVRYVWKGVGQTWMLMNASARPFIREIMEVIIGTFEEIVKVRGYHRVQTFVRAGDHSSAKIAEMYGLKFESTMKAYGPNREDYHIYAQVKE